LINKPDAWATIFATQSDRRSFVETCLERSCSVPLEVTIDARSRTPTHPLCTCDKYGWSTLVHNEINPCEWHFVFDPLAETGHSGRIHALRIYFSSGTSTRDGGGIWLRLRSSRFFDSPPFPLTSLEWNNEYTDYADGLFSTSLFRPTLRFLSFRGSWDEQLMKFNNLTSFTYSGYEELDAEDLRAFLVNNQSLETLFLDFIEPSGPLNGPPATLPNLRSITLYSPQPILSTIFHAPALRNLSSLSITFVDEVRGRGLFTFHAAGDAITLTIKDCLKDLLEAWHDLAGYSRPTIRHIRLENPEDIGVDDLVADEADAIITLIADAHTLEIGRGYVKGFYPNFLRDLNLLWPQLKTIRFEIPEDTKPLSGSDVDGDWKLLGVIEDLVKYRFEHGRRFASVERMIVSESERVNRLEDAIWRCFYDDRGLGHYLGQSR
jgi:hypothetical protein